MFFSHKKNRKPDLKKSASAGTSISFACVFLCVLFCALFAGCFNPVFNSIRNEVALEEAEISGFINSIVRFTNTEQDGTEKEYLYLQNGRIYYKQVSEDDDPSKLTKNMANKSWTRDSGIEEVKYNYEQTEYSGWNVYKLASDSKYVYALCYQPWYNEDYSRNEPRKIRLFCSSGVNSEWKEVSAVNTAIEDYINHLNPDLFMMDSSILLFCTNTPKKDHRQAFIRIGGGNPSTSTDSADTEYNRVNYEENYGNRNYGNYGILKLDGENTQTSESNTIKAGTKGATYRTLSVYYANGDTHFSNHLAVATDETKNDDAKYVYYGDGNTLKSFSVDTLTSNGTTEVFMPNREGKLVNESDFTVDSVYVLDAYINGLAIDTEGNKAALTNTDEIINSSGCAASIQSIAATKDSVLLGTYEYGAYRVPKTYSTGEPATSTDSFSTNASSIMASPYIIRMIFCTDPSVGEVEDGSALYSSMEFRYTESTSNADYDNVGLWSYYYNRTSDPSKNWNRE